MIRPAEPRDAEALTAIHNHYVRHSTATLDTEPVTAESMRAQIETLIECRRPCFVYELEGAVAGYAWAQTWAPRGACCHTVETTVVVAPDRTGHGIGRELLTALVEACRGCGDHALMGCITEGHPAAEALYRRVGFDCVTRFERLWQKFGNWVGTSDYEMIL